MDLVLRSVALAEAASLTTAMVSELSNRYGGEGASPVDGNDFLPPYGVLLVAAVNGQDAACGGLRRLEGQIGEVKRMYTAPAFRGRGVARALLPALIEHARSVGLGEVWLETGILQPEAIALYESAGFTGIPAYGYYRDEPMSRCYGLVL